MPVGRCMALQREGIELSEQTAQLRTGEALDKLRPGHPPLALDSTAQHLQVIRQLRPRVGSVLDTLQQDIQIADRAEPACQASQAALHRSQPRSRKYRDLLQQLKRRPQAPRGDAHIMYALGITVSTGRWLTQPQ